jgi:predicted GNAT family acetyltransferase
LPRCATSGHDVVVRAVITDSPEQFSVRVGDFLDARLEHNVLATVLFGVLADPDGHPGALFASVDDDGVVVAAALRTPPRRMLSSVMDGALADRLIEEWLSVDPELPGVSASEPAASHLASAWERATGGRATVALSEAVHQLQRVLAPARPATGAMRPAASSDRTLLVRWFAEFSHEAGVYAGDVGRLVDRRLAGGGLFLWEDPEPVSMVGLLPAVAAVVRIGPVYTPSEYRNHGYASSAVAAASALALAEGAHRCMLLTDLANPTSNRIYQALGYERCAEWREYDFNA